MTVAEAATEYQTLIIGKRSLGIEERARTGTSVIAVTEVEIDATAAVEVVTKIVTTDDAATALTARTTGSRGRNDHHHRIASDLLDEV
jgi:hypothetical protein